jgi:hypothetical protein
MAGSAVLAPRDSSCLPFADWLLALSLLRLVLFVLPLGLDTFTISARFPASRLG